MSYLPLTMGTGKTFEEKALLAAATALGIKDPRELGTQGKKGLSKFTLKQLQDCAKKLELPNVAKLSKDDLIDRIATLIKTLFAKLAKTAKPQNEAKPANGGKTTNGDKTPNGATPTNGVKKATKTEPSNKPKAPPSTETEKTQGGVERAEPLTHKFEVGAHGKADEATTIPWTYNYDRVTAMAVDPERLFVYWEVTDEGIDRARHHLGKAGATAWLCLRIYDTTDRIFDGTNAHAYFDHKVERTDRHWFFQIAKPASAAFVDIGLKSVEGYFAKITRSGRVEFPRREPVSWGEPEWLSVRSMWGPVEHAGRGPHMRRQAPGLAPAAAAGPPPGPGPRRHVALLPWEESFLVPESERRDVTEWEEHFQDGHVEFHRQMYWESPVMVSAWEAGPFSYPVTAPEPVRHDFVGPTRMYRVGNHTHVVYGPWQVLIRGLGAHHGQAVVARWEIFRSWVAEERAQIVDGSMQEVPIPGSSERRLIGASELAWRYGSELRLGGASEVYFLGASEIFARGASERLFAGASQWTQRGASERLLGGASEIHMKGASERLYSGASEARLGGGSESRLGAGSDLRLANSENHPSPPPEDSPYPSADSISKEPEHKD